MMFAVDPGNRTHELKLLSFQEASTNLRKPMTKPKKTPNQKRKADQKLSTKEANSPELVSKKTPNRKRKSDHQKLSAKETNSPDLVSKKTPNRKRKADESLSAEETNSPDLVSKKRVPCFKENISSRTAVECYRVAKARNCEREAARNKILKLERETDARDNHQLFKELELLCGCRLGYQQQTTSLPYLQRRFGLTLEPSITEPRFSCLEREREAARKSVLKTEEAAADVDGRNNLQLFQELENLCGCSLVSEHPPYLEIQFGLKLKPITETEEKEKPILDLSVSRKRVSAVSACDETPSCKIDKEKAESALQYQRLMESMPLPPSHDDIQVEDHDWLFKPKRQKVENIDHVTSCMQQPYACFLPEAQPYALPYTVPF